MKKNVQLNQWLWKWHVIAGLVSLPFMLLLAITGVIYLFKADYNQQVYQSTMQVAPATTAALNYNQQLLAAQQSTQKPIVGVTLPSKANQATLFKVQGKGRATNTLYVNPYTAEVTGVVDQKQTLMYTVRKLHGEILLSKAGTLTVELIASWFAVLILTGLYVWWPKAGSGVAGFFLIRTSKGKRIFWRDLHAVTGFWLSLVMLAVLAGGMPWTDVFGSQLKWVQAQTDTGYPQHWRSSKGLESKGLTSNLIKTQPTSLTLDQVVTISKSYNLPGELSIILPTTQTGVYSLSNRAFWLDEQQVIHLDQYSGNIVKSYTWDDVGVLMELRQVFMRLHQGEYGPANWWIMVMIGLAFIVATTAGLVSYLMRKTKGSWSIPTVPSRFNVDKTLVAFIIGLGLLFPMFGASLLLLWLWEQKGKFVTNSNSD
ncbi:PepSY-associated TM helix domain-containing protein [Paraglaciecola sp.]|uniref:PepSY-associated TM helix domain-containing protein n=1 Tax=Paraglaciecola sp. TaxID=1920173 RepID=UPI003EF6EF3B